MASDDGVRAQALEAYAALKGSIDAFVARHPKGVRNSEVARELGLQTDYNGGQRNYLTFSILNMLVQDGRLHREKRGSHVYYSPADSDDPK